MRVTQERGHTDVLVLRGREVSSLMMGKEPELMDIVRSVYCAHASGETTLPHSTFLRFPEQPRNRIIALPAYLRSAPSVAGLKWIASFPSNGDFGLARASAVIILNSPETGRPEAILEGSVISAKRTAASAAIAAKAIHFAHAGISLGVIGCGMINCETVRFLTVTFPAIQRLVLFDTTTARAEMLKANLQYSGHQSDISIATTCVQVLRTTDLISIATTASEPHINSVSVCSPGATILHISLRDIDPQALLQCVNVVDDIDHVLRENTSLHVAEQITGERTFIHATIGEILLGSARAERNVNSPIVFNPFGLGILDIAIAQWVVQRAHEQEIGMAVEEFLLPTSLRKGCE